MCRASTHLCGAVTGTVGRPYGVLPGILGCGAGAVLAVPALGVTLAAVVGVLMLGERAARRCRLR